jgi:2-oxoisovalerate dehydrogenase E2 component (dihydrolipoyl transacylase)
VKTFNLPDLGEGLPEAEIVKWHVSQGEDVVVDAPLVSVETAKAVVDVPCPYTGTIARLYAGEGDVVETGKPLVDFAVEGDDIDAPATGASPGVASATAHAGTTAASGQAPDGATTSRADTGTVVGNVVSSDELVEETAIAGQQRRATRGRVKALPSVRAEAHRRGIDLTRVTPTGRNGQVTQADLQRHGQQRGAAVAPPSPAPVTSLPSMPAAATSPPESGPLRGPRRAMAQSMARSRSEVMECTIFDDADIHAWLPGQDITVRVLRAIAAGVRGEPALNAWYDGEQLSRTIHAHVDVAMAVDGPQGLIVPVIRRVDQKHNEALRADINELKTATRARTVAPEQMRDPTIMLSNFGMLAGRYATPVVVPPCVAILGTGGVRHDVVAVMGGIEAHRRIPLSLTFDHRACTGGEACRFLAAVIADLGLAT